MSDSETLAPFQYSLPAANSSQSWQTASARPGRCGRQTRREENHDESHEDEIADLGDVPIAHHADPVIPVEGACSG